MVAESFTMQARNWYIPADGHAQFAQVYASESMAINGPLTANGWIDCTELTSRGPELSLATYGSTFDTGAWVIFPITITHLQHKMFYTRTRVGAGTMRIVVANRALSLFELATAPAGGQVEGGTNGIFFVSDQYGSGVLAEAFAHRFINGNYWIHCAVACAADQPNGVEIVCHMRDIP
jgi:hypothetical protein